MNDRYLNQPREVSIETLALCNAACEFCPYETLERRGTKMSNELLADLCNQMRDWKEPFQISPFKVNEPFLDKRLLPLCRDIIDGIKMAKLRIFTNGSRFTPDNVQELLDLDPQRVLHIWISLNEVDAVRYKEVMKYVAFEHVADKLDILHRVWLRRIRHKIVVSRVGNVAQESEARDRIQFEGYIWKRWPGFVPFTIKRDAWIDYTTAASDRVPETTCARWWELNICANGVAALCCMDGKGEYAVGNVNEQRLLDIYNQPAMRWKRLGALRSEVNPCNRCTY